MQDTLSTKLVIGTAKNPVRFSYAYVWEPRAQEEGGKLKYQVTCLIPKTDKAMIAKIKAAIQAAIELGTGSKFKAAELKNPKFWNPLRDGDIDLDKEGNPKYPDHMFVQAKSDTKPGIVDAKVNPIIDRSEFYSGCYGLCSTSFYPFNTKMIGIGCGLNNLQKLKDGESLGGRTRAEDDFEEIEDDPLAGI